MHGKRSPEGKRDRIEMMERHFPGAFERARVAFRRRDVASDDILDALAALWTAERVARGEARCIPAVPPVDACGLPIRTVY